MLRSLSKQEIQTDVYAAWIRRLSARFRLCGEIGFGQPSRRRVINGAAEHRFDWGRGEPLPPIEVYRVGGLHFVQDDHHRVSIAAATGQETIDAYVTEVLTAVPAKCTGRRGDQIQPGPGCSG